MSQNYYDLHDVTELKEHIGQIPISADGKWSLSFLLVTGENAYM